MDRLSGHGPGRRATSMCMRRACTGGTTARGLLSTPCQGLHLSSAPPARWQRLSNLITGIFHRAPGPGDNLQPADPGQGIIYFPESRMLSRNYPQFSARWQAARWTLAGKLSGDILQIPQNAASEARSAGGRSNSSSPAAADTFSPSSAATSWPVRSVCPPIGLVSRYRVQRGARGYALAVSSG